jgi:pimeloyl-ACP methyl ester carboxylesterase
MVKKIYFDQTDMDQMFAYALGVQGCKCSELGECFYVASKISEEDIETWVRAWTETAIRIENFAKNAETKGHRVSAREAYLRAFTYHRMAEYGLRANDTRWMKSFNSARSCFRRSMEMQDFRVEVINIPFENKSLPGYFAIPNDNRNKRPTLMMGGGTGFSEAAEDLFAFGVPAGVSRGYNILLIDLPGQGITPLDGLFMRADVEIPVKSVVDYLFSRKDVDTSRIAIEGMGAGGYNAARAAAYEKRINASIANSPVADAMSITGSGHQTMTQGPARQGFVTDLFDQIKGSGGGVRGVITAMVTEKMVIQAGIRSPMEMLQKFRDASFDVGKITCPMLCLASAGDPAQAVGETKRVYEELSNPKKAIHIFTEEEGADMFRQFNNFTLREEVMFDWLDEVFDHHLQF